ncbi:MAG: hypothetical protein JWO33_1574 [Caulobacteraceae bacterium]|nr:hypothetical protein [Caulobacteraceae bacterium]
MPRHIIGIDVGGTFTDCAVLKDGAVIATAKSPTMPGAIDEGVMNALAVAAEDLGLSLREFLQGAESVTHGSTVVTNAIVERRGAKTGLLTTMGFEDTIIIGKAIQKAAGLSERELTNQAGLRNPVPLVPRHLIRGVTERIDRDGDIVAPIDEAQAIAALDDLVAQGVEAIAVCFLWSFVQARHEQWLVETCRARHPGVYVLASHEVAPLLGEYERTSTTVLHCYAGPAVIAYLGRLEQKLAQAGYDGKLLIAHASGGVTTVGDILRKPLLMLDSGPASGVVGARRFAAVGGQNNVICADMGGTTFDVAAIVDGGFLVEEEPVIGQYHYLLPKIAIKSIGAGGGSIVWSDVGVIHVGPRSAGAEPGPACYGQGGQAATITDVDLTLGFLNPGGFLGGRKLLDEGLARDALQRVGDQVGLSAVDVALAAFTVVNAQMADLISRTIIEQGHDPRDFALLAYGGAGSIHVAYLAQELGLSTVYVSPSASVFSALGMLCGGVTHLTQRAVTLRSPFDSGADDQLAGALAELRHELTASFSQEGIAPGEIAFEPTVHIKYATQPRAIAVPVADWLATPDPGLARLSGQFEAAYSKILGEGSGHALAGFEITKCSVTGQARNLADISAAPADRMTTRALTTTLQRKVRFPDMAQAVDCPVFRGGDLRSGDQLPGPCIIDRMGDTIVIPAFAVGRIDAVGNVVLELENGQ